MFRKLWLSLPLAGLFFLGGCGATQNSAKHPLKQVPSVKAPVYAEGDWWIFRTKSPRKSLRSVKEIRVTYKNGKFDSDDPTFLDSIDWIALHLKDSKKKWLNFPLVPGKEWSFTFLYTRRRTGRASFHEPQAIVVGPTPQPVQTASGKHKVTEIRAVDTWGSGGSINREYTYFYSSKTKSVVKLMVEFSNRERKEHSEAELIKYSVR